MRVILVLLALCICFLSYSAQACNRILPWDNTVKMPEDAYFFGLVKTKYIQQYENGALNKAGLQPFMVYFSAPDVDLDKMIIVEGDLEDSTCEDIYLGGIKEVFVLKKEGKLQLLHYMNLNSDLINGLQKKARYAASK